MDNLAPVLIITLNRCQHLKRCIESLQKNSLAPSTELYISVDFPPSGKYEKGNREVLNYLNAGISGFKEVHVYRQERNLGVFENDVFLKEKVFEKHDRYIFTEDDNIFSENYLEYMNYYLKKYEDDEEIFAVCGYSYPINWGENENTVIKSTMLSAWGYGSWKKKYLKYKTFHKNDIRQYLGSFKRGIELFKRNRHIFSESVLIACDRHYFPMYDSDGYFYDMDLVVGIRLYMTGERVIMPVLSKVRNEGHDGSGVNCAGETESVFENQPLDKNCHYISSSEPMELTGKQEKAISEYFPVGIKSSIKALLLWMELMCRVRE